MPLLREERILRAPGPRLSISHNRAPISLPVSDTTGRIQQPKDSQGSESLHPLQTLHPAIKDENDKSLFAFRNRGYQVVISIDTELAAGISDELAQKSMDVCPVGAILKKRKGFEVPIGRRPFDKVEIGAEVGGRS